MIVALGFLSLAMAALAGDIVGVGEFFDKAAQADQPKTEAETWRAGEKKFAEFMELTRVLTLLDAPGSTNLEAQVIRIPLPGPAAQRSVSEIEKHCGAAYLSDTNKAGPLAPPELLRVVRDLAPLLHELSNTNIAEARVVLYGRFGYLTVDGQSITALWATHSVLSLNKPEKPATLKR